MSIPSLKRQGSKTTSKEHTIKTKPGKVRKINVCPSPEIAIRSATKIATNIAGMIPEKSEDVPPLIETRPERGTPDGFNGRESSLEMDATQPTQPWSNAENGHRDGNSPSNFPRLRRNCPETACMMRSLVAMAFIFSLANLCLTLTILFTRGNNGACACQEKSQALGKPCDINLGRLPPQTSTRKSKLELMVFLSNSATFKKMNRRKVRTVLIAPFHLSGRSFGWIHGVKS